MTPEDEASGLLARHGPPEAWQIATTAAIDAHLAGEAVTRDHWKAVQFALTKIAPRPGPGDLDIYRTAKLLIGAHGEQEAARMAWERAIALDGDLAGQVVWLRIGDAVAALSSKGPEAGRKVS